MGGGEVVALVSVISSALVALIVAFLGPRSTGVQQRFAEREKYLREKRSEAYIEALTEVQGDLLSFLGIESIIGKSTKPGISREQLWDLNSRLALYGPPNSAVFGKGSGESW